MPVTKTSSTAMCVNCLKSQVDITEGISKTVPLQHCRECNRYLRPPWTSCELESPQLLSLCLSHIKGLKRVKMVDASWIWTEPHSRRLKIKLTIQKEVMGSTMLQQTLVVEFVITNLQCDDCKVTYTPHLFQSQVQVRQNVEHKRTFLFLEQIILKHQAAEKCVGIKQEEGGNGLNFHFKHRSHAQRLVNFIGDNVICKEKHTKTLISHDEQNGTYNYKYTFIVDLAPVCRDDLVIVPKALSRLMGGVGPMCLVYKVTKFVHLVDIKTMQTFEIDNKIYWKHMFKGVLTRDRLTEFVVLNIDNVDTNFNESRAANRNKFRQVQVEIARKNDYSATFIVNTHLGEILNFNDTVLAYDLTSANISEVEGYQQEHLCNEDVVIVRKTYPKMRNRQRNRLWKLKHFDQKKDDEDMNEANPEEQAEDEEEQTKKKQKKKSSRSQKRKQREENKRDFKNDKDYELFLQDIEDDKEFRGNMNLYKDEDVIAQLQAQIAGMTLEEKPSQLTNQLKSGSSQVEGEDRKIKAAKRKTKEGK